MKFFPVILLVLLSPCAFAVLPDAWRTVIDNAAATNAVYDYVSAAPHFRWAGDIPNVADLMPANASFQFALAGDAASVSNAQQILDRTQAALPADLRDRLRKCRLLGPTLQWMLRYTKPGVTNQTLYLKSAAHPAAFSPKDLDLTSLTNLAARMGNGSCIPPVVAIRPVCELYRRVPAEPTQPTLDYPGFQPETTYATPFGVGMVLRAPECVRSFRFYAAAWPNPKLRVTFAWVPLTPGVNVSNWYGGRDGRLAKDGFGVVRVDRRAIRRLRRADVAVFAKVEGGLWGPPSIISFYPSPYEERSYAKDRKLQTIRYQPAKTSPLPPYPLGSLCLPADWSDSYQYDEKDRIFRFSRTLPGDSRQIEFSNRGEQVLEHHASDTPKVTLKVRYYEEDGQLRFAPTDEKVVYGLNNLPACRLRGE